MTEKAKTFQLMVVGLSMGYGVRQTIHFVPNDTKYAKWYFRHAENKLACCRGHAGSEYEVTSVTFQAVRIDLWAGWGNQEKTITSVNFF